MKESTENIKLADSCEQSDVTCCKSGFIFLPRAEYDLIVDYLKDNAEALEEFRSRIIDHEDFLLYNQQSRCQFLKENNLCELHPPLVSSLHTECFWWPAHVYVGSEGLEVRVASCCDGCSCLKTDSPHIAKLVEQAEEIGHELLSKFRSIHSYGDGYRVVKKI